MIIFLPLKMSYFFLSFLKKLFLLILEGGGQRCQRETSIGCLSTRTESTAGHVLGPGIEPATLQCPELCSTESHWPLHLFSFKPLVVCRYTKI